MARTEREVTNRRFGMAATYEGGDPAFLDRIVPAVDYLEITPDSIAGIKEGRPRLKEGAIRELQTIGKETKVLVHGVGLSIGTASGWNETYLHLLDQLLPHVNLQWHSEHLGFTEVGGEHLGTMLALPRTHRMLDLVCKRVTQLQRLYDKPFLIENIVHMLPDAPADFTEAAFLNQITTRTGCQLILDVYNLECDAHNLAFDIVQFLQELDLRHVREIHLAGGVVHRGLQLDVHSRTVANSTLDLAKSVIALAPNLEAVTYELLPQSIPLLGYETITAELARIRNILEA